MSYIPDSRPHFYGGPTLLEAARRLPDLRFEVMGGVGLWAEKIPSNVHFLGWVEDPAVVYARSTCVIRTVDHDSIGGTAVEGLLFGRPVLYTEELSHSRQVMPNADSVCRALRELVEEWTTGQLTPDHAVAAWARTEFDHDARFIGLASELFALQGTVRQPRLSYLTLQATTEGQAAHAHVNEIVRGLAEAGWSCRVLRPVYRRQPAHAMDRLIQFARIQCIAIGGLSKSDAFYIRSHFAALPAALFARVLHVPVVQEVNGPHEDAIVAWPTLRALGPLIEKLNRIQLRRAKAVITVTPQLVQWIESDADVDGVHLIPNGADVERFSPGISRPAGLPAKYIVFFGALAPWQGVEVALDAAVSDSWPDDVALVIVGDGRMRGLVQERADNNRVVYLGRRLYAEMPGIVSNAIASLVPMDASSRTASGLAPLKLFESMACGVPIIGSDLPGLADIILDAECGLLVKPGSPEDLARAAKIICEDASQATVMGALGRKSAVQRHSWRSRAADTASVLRAIVADPASRSLKVE